MQAEQSRLSKAAPNKAAMVLHKEAVANIAKDPDAHRITHNTGFCGLGGMPS